MQGMRLGMIRLLFLIMYFTLLQHLSGENYEEDIRQARPLSRSEGDR